MNVLKGFLAGAIRKKVDKYSSGSMNGYQGPTSALKLHKMYLTEEKAFSSFLKGY